MKLLVLAAVVIASVSSVCANNLHPEITPAPKAEDLQKRQGYSDLIGWYSSSDYWYSYTCPSGQYYAAGPRFGACCPTGEPYCNPLVACEGNVGVYSNGVRGDCGTEICDTVTIFNSQDVAATGIHSLVACFSSDRFYSFPRTYYRATFALTTSTTNEPETSTATATKTVTQTATPGLGVKLLQDGMWKRLCIFSLLAVFLGFML